MVTQPDRPKGRKQELIALAGQGCRAPPWPGGLPAGADPPRRKPSSTCARSRPRSWWSSATARSFRKAIIDIAPLGIINVHASLLPELRGAAPIQWSIARGYNRTGVTTMRIDAGLDTGDILLQWETPIGPDETAPELSPRLAEAGADLLVETLAGLAHGTIQPRPQDNARAT